MSKKLPGLAAFTGNCGSSGNHTDHNGIGAASLSIRRSDGTWLDLLEIWFQDMDQERYDSLDLDKTTSPSGCDFAFSENGKALSGARRRLSKRQATWLTNRLSAFIQSLGQIPSDEEIANPQKANVKEDKETYRVEGNTVQFLCDTGRVKGGKKVFANEITITVQGNPNDKDGAEAAITKTILVAGKIGKLLNQDLKAKRELSSPRLVDDLEGNGATNHKH